MATKRELQVHFRENVDSMFIPYKDPFIFEILSSDSRRVNQMLKHSPNYQFTIRDKVKFYGYHNRRQYTLPVFCLAETANMFFTLANFLGYEPWYAVEYGVPHMSLVHDDLRNDPRVPDSVRQKFQPLDIPGRDMLIKWVNVIRNYELGNIRGHKIIRPLVLWEVDSIYGPAAEPKSEEDDADSAVDIQLHVPASDTEKNI